MKKLLLGLVLVSTVTVHASVLQDVPRDQIDFFEITHSPNTICAVNFKLKASQDDSVQEIVTQSDSGSLQVKVPEEALLKSNYALLVSDCGLNQLRMMLVAQDLHFMYGKTAMVPAQFQVSVVLKNGEKLKASLQRSEYPAQLVQDVWGNQDVVFENKPALHLDMVKFKN